MKKPLKHRNISQKYIKDGTGREVNQNTHKTSAGYICRSVGYFLIFEAMKLKIKSVKKGGKKGNLLVSDAPYFSVIVPMYREHVNKLLEQLNQQTFKDFEAIIVNSGEERGDFLHDLCTFKLKYIFKRDIGAVKARNIGLKRAIGKIIAFTDDDCQPDADWLENAKSYFENDNINIVGLEGYVYSDGRKINDQRYRIVTNRRLRGIGFMTANLFIRHDIAEKVGEFDERFDKPLFREDTDFAWRAQNYGRISFAENVHVYHPPILRELECKSKKDTDCFFVNDALLFVKHPEKYIKLMRTAGYYKCNKNFWRFFLEGCEQINEKIPVELMLKDPEISKHVPDELKVKVKEKEKAQKTSTREESRKGYIKPKSSVYL